MKIDVLWVKSIFLVSGLSCGIFPEFCKIGYLELTCIIVMKSRMRVIVLCYTIFLCIYSFVSNIIDLFVSIFYKRKTNINLKPSIKFYRYSTSRSTDPNAMYLKLFFQENYWIIKNHQKRNVIFSNENKCFTKT